MSHLSTPHSLRNGAAPAADQDNGHAVDIFADFGMDDELKRLAAVNQQLLNRGNAPSDSQIQLDIGEDANEMARLRMENAELRNRLEEMEQLLASAAASEETWLERQKEYEALLEEKSEVIRGLHLKIHELQEGQHAAPVQRKAGARVDDEEALALKQELEEQRRQLEEDEKALMEQMRQMELAMSRDRAELARQRNEIQRLQAELNREIELASRDPGLRERLQALQRRQPDSAATRKPATPAPAPAPAPAAPPAEGSNKKQSSGLLRRIFGGK